MLYPSDTQDCSARQDFEPFAIGNAPMHDNTIVKNREKGVIVARILYQNYAIYKSVTNT